MIRPEKLKALTGEGIHWLTRVCQVAWKFGKIPRDWQTGVIIPIFKEIASNAAYKLRRDITPQFARESMPNALKRKCREIVE